jgi:hypothetical protein
MDDDAHMTYEDPAANAPDVAALDRGKGKGKAVDYPEAQRSVNKDEDMSSEEESEAEEPVSLTNDKLCRALPSLMKSLTFHFHAANTRAM